MVLFYYIAPKKCIAEAKLFSNYFNPRFREGSDYIEQQNLEESKIISIHASARKATKKAIFLSDRLSDFNPRFREGSDEREKEIICLRYGFQSTLPRGKRQNFFSCVRSFSTFQSTLPRGKRPSICVPVEYIPQFQSTLPRGKRRFVNIVTSRYVNISIHASAREAT